MSTEQDRELRLRAAAMQIVETPADFRRAAAALSKEDNQKGQGTVDGQA